MTRIRRPTLHTFVTAAVATAGLVASASFFLFDRAAEQSTAKADLERRVRERVELLRSKVAGSAEVLHGIASLFDVWGQVPRAEFARFVAPSLARQPELLALSWTPRVAAAEVPRYEAAAQADGLRGFRFIEHGPGGKPQLAAARAEYLPIYYIAPVPRNEIALGFDLRSDPVRAQTLDTARDRGQALATPPIHLVQETTSELGFLVFLPVYQGGHVPETLEARRAGLYGYTTAVYRIPDLVNPAFAGLANDLSLKIEDRTTGHDVIYRRPASVGAGTPIDALASEALLPLAGRQWALVLTPTPHALAAQMTWRPWIALLIGLSTTGLLSGYINTIARRRAVVEQRVTERTQALQMEIAERRRAEDQATQAERQYRSIFENCIEGIFQTSLDGHYLSVNPALTAIYGYDRPEDLIRDLSDIEAQLYVDPDRREQFVRAVQQAGVVTHFESQIRRRDGSIIWISENARAVRDASGSVAYYEGTVEDITERKLAEERLRKLNDELEERVRQRTAELDRANRAKSMFLANVSHEFRTPMNAILGYAQLLQRDPTVPPHHRDALDTIIAGGDHLLALIEELIDLSRIESQRADADASLTPIDLASLLDELFLLLRNRAEQKGLGLRFNLTIPRPCNVLADDGGLRKVLINLIGNGVKYTDAGSVTVRVRAEANRYHFEVADTGVGIPANSIGEIFKPFVQGDSGLSRGGSGLGLSIARRHVAIMGGELRVESIVGQGSRFSFSLELQPAVAVEPSLSTPPTIRPSDGNVEIPADLLARLLHSADMGSVTEIKSCLAELDTTGPATAAFADRLRDLLKRYDMDAIGQLLNSGAVQSRINRSGLAATGEPS